MNNTQDAPRWDGVERRAGTERRKPSAPAAPAAMPVPAVPTGTAGRFLRRVAEAALARAGGNLLGSGTHLLVLYVFTHWH